MERGDRDCICMGLGHFMFSGYGFFQLRLVHVVIPCGTNKRPQRPPPQNPYIYMFICIHSYIYIYVFIYIYIQIHTHTHIYIYILVDRLAVVQP